MVSDDSRLSSSGVSWRVTLVSRLALDSLIINHLLYEILFVKVTRCLGSLYHLRDLDLDWAAILKLLIPLSFLRTSC